MNETQTKVCTKCKIEKLVTEFNKQKAKKTGFSSWCRECTHDRYKRNAAKISEKMSEYYIKNKSLISEKKKIYRKENAEKIYQKNIAYNKANAECLAKKRSERNKKNRKIINHKRRDYYHANREHFAKYVCDYISKRSQTDPMFLIKKRIRCLVTNSLIGRGYTKKSRTNEILGCSYEEFKTHIESQFLDGMSWGNRSEWHIDHFIPLASAKTESEILKLNHYSNLRPMWALDNIRKGAKMPHEHNYK